jgi:hypothetical protein
MKLFYMELEVHDGRRKEWKIDAGQPPCTHGE